MTKKNNSMIEIQKTTSAHTDFVKLVKALDTELAVRDGDLHDFYHQYNSIENLNHVVLAYQDGKAVGCGAFKPFDHDSVEIKRMFVPKTQRGKGIASKVLQSLEGWAKELGFKQTILETGKGQPEAIALYMKKGYVQTENYGQYTGIANSLCFQKNLLITPTTL